tara:strand:- start:263 stop:427 length:165 start_codon:yes stop_codon:yes gene_type:complete
MLSSTKNPLKSLGLESKEDLGFETELDLELALAPLMEKKRKEIHYKNKSNLISR